MSGLYDDDFSSAPSVVTSVPAPTTGSLYGEDDTATTPVPLGESMSLVSDEAKAAAKAGVKQVSQAASLATAGLKTKFTELRGQPIGSACKKVCVGIAVLTILACGGLEWRAHRSSAEPVAVVAAQPVIQQVPVVAKAVPATVAIAAASTLAPPPVTAAVKPNPLEPKSFNPQSPNYRATGVTVAAPTTQTPTVTAQPNANPLAPKSFNPMSPNYRGPRAATPGAVSAPEAAAPAAATVTKTAQPSLAPKSFNPRSPNYKPVKPAAKSQWETEQDQKLNSYFHKGTSGG
jgi:hypothetical protein